MEFDKRITELESLLSRKESFIKKIDEANKELSVLKLKKARLIETLKQNNLSISKLDQYSIVELWFESLENKHKLSKDEHDYKFISILIDSITKEVNSLNEKLAPLYQYEEEYCELLKQQKDFSNKEVNQIREINKQVNAYKVNIKDINDCMAIGNQLLQMYHFIINNLDKAKKWKALDIFGTGLLANIAKSSYLKEADEKMTQILYLSERFSRELMILDHHLGIHINIKELNEFSTYITDKLYEDMTDSKKITNLIDYIKQSNRYVLDTLNYLNLIKEDYIQKIINLESYKK